MTISRLEINLTKQDRRSTSTSSKGNQIKWYKEGYWFKANSMGYEDIAEWVSSKILSFSNIPQNMYVPYELCTIREEDGKVYKGCVSQNFLSNGETLITLGRLLLSQGVDVDTLLRENSLEYRIAYILNFVKTYAKVDMTGYLQTLLTLDALILNEDRHFHNIALIYNEVTRQFRLCPIFDNGLSLLSDIKDYDYTTPLGLNIGTVHAKPFSINFDKQMLVLGYGLRVNGTALHDFITLNKDTLGRVADVLEHQMVKYRGKIIF